MTEQCVKIERVMEENKKECYWRENWNKEKRGALIRKWQIVKNLTLRRAFLAFHSTIFLRFEVSELHHWDYEGFKDHLSSSE